MRTEQEMFALILDTANENERIRAVYMNGSRANPHVARDKYQDYDIVYVVTEIEWFLQHKEWISVFGEPAIVQEPDKNDQADGIDVDISQSYAWLMLFTDGNRIDLTIELLSEGYGQDKLTVPLLDKDNILPKIPAPSDEDYAVRKPTEAQYLGNCNNFWWCLQNVAKGIARDQLTYAMNMYGRVVHQNLENMVDWYIGALNNYSVSVGMWGKYYRKYLPPELYTIYVGTFSDGDYVHLWNAIFSACELFKTIAPMVGAQLGYCYSKQEEDGMIHHLLTMRIELQ